MRVIHRYPIMKTQNVTSLAMPRDAEILTFAAKNNEPSIWVVVETDNEPEERRFLLVWTGREPPPKPAQYVGTVQTFEEAGPAGYGHPPEQQVVVWHLFEVPTKVSKPLAWESTAPGT
jgi:hypothetical protein